MPWQAPAAPPQRVAARPAAASSVARARAVVLPAVAALAVLGLIGFARVDSEFEFSDFYSEESDFIEGLDLLDEHFGSSTGAGDGLLYIETGERIEGRAVGNVLLDEPARGPACAEGHH